MYIPPTWTAVLAAVLTLTVVVPQTSAGERELLPDLRQAPVGCPGGFGGDPAQCQDWDVCMVADPAAPNGECLRTGDIRAVRLRFTAAEDNVGDGPLLLYGHRDGTGSPTMRVRQAVQVGRHGRIPGSYREAARATATSMYYEPAEHHQHWHLMGFEHMQLRTPGGSTVVADRKNGFCLGDRYRTADAGTLAYAVRDPLTPEGRLADYLRRNNCGHRDTGATDMAMGISVGSGDDYRFGVDFQWLDITRVPSGVYDVVNTVNADRTLAETRYDNNSSSIAIAVHWPAGARTATGAITAPPTVTLLRSCPGRPRCASTLDRVDQAPRSAGGAGTPGHRPLVSSDHLHHGTSGRHSGHPGMAGHSG